ncbi:MAG: cupin domain-containing protein, partial [Cytophagales bacterium]|nr:cupin domain-containing protein [Armatimonadota bacterium]
MNNDFLSNPDRCEPLVVCTGQGHPYHFLGGGITGACLLSTRETGGAFAVFEEAFGPEAGTPLQVHHNEDILLYSLDGPFRVQRGGEVFDLHTGTALYLPRGVRQSLVNIGGRKSRLLRITNSATYEAYCESVNAARGILEKPGKSALALLETLMSNHNRELLSPSGAAVRSGSPIVTGPLLELGDHRGTALISSEETNGTILLVVGEADPQGGVPPHIHHCEDEAFYLLQGRLTLMVGNQTIEAGPGDCIFAPRGVPHAWRNTGATPTSFLTLISPGANFESFIQEMSRIVAQAGNRVVTPETAPALFAQVLP